MNTVIAGSLTYDTKMDTKGIDSGLDKIDKKSSNLADSMKIAIGNIIADLARMTAEGLKEIAKAGVEYNAQIEKYQTALTTLTGSAEEANQIIEQIKKDAAKTPFDVSGLVQANQLLISAGVSSEQARDDILALGNAVSATGGGNDELQRMAVNLQQIKNVGKASALDIKQFAYAGIDVYGLLADSMGITREEASELDVTYEDLTEALRKAAEDGGKYAGAMEAQSKTFNGQVSNLKDNLDQLIGNAMTPLFNLLRDDILPAVNDLIQGEGDVEVLLSNLSTRIAEFISNALGKLLEMLPQLVDIGIKIIVSLIEGITKELPNLLSKSIEAVGNIGDTIINNLDSIINAGIGLVLALAKGTAEELPNLVEKVPDWVVQIADKITEPETLSNIVEAGIQIIWALLKGMTKTIPELLKMPRTIGRNVADRFREETQNIDWGEFGKWVIEGIKKGVEEKATSLYNSVKSVLSKALKKAKEVLGIASPSKVMRDEVGQWIPKGIAVGIEANTDSIDDAIDDVNDDIMNKMTQAVNVETGKLNYSGTNGTVSQMLSAFGTTTVVNDNKLYLDGDEIYENQQTVTAKKNLQTQFGGGYSVSS